MCSPSSKIFLKRLKWIAVLVIATSTGEPLASESLLITRLILSIVTHSLELNLDFFQDQFRPLDVIGNGNRIIPRKTGGTKTIGIGACHF